MDSSSLWLPSWNEAHQLQQSADSSPVQLLGASEQLLSEIYLGISLEYRFQCLLLLHLEVAQQPLQAPESLEFRFQRCLHSPLRGADQALLLVTY